MPAFVGIKPGEFFAGNISGELPDYLRALETVRLGDVALTIDGEALPPCYRPLFVGLIELNQYDSIMLARFARLKG